MRASSILRLSLMAPLLLSCSDIMGLDDDARRNFESLIGLIGAGDTSAIHDLFSEKVIAAIPNLDEQINDLIVYVEGDYEKTISRSLGSTKTQDGFYVQYIFDYNNWDIKTSSSYYYFNIYWYFMDDFDGENIGIWCLTVEEHELGEDATPLEKWGEDPESWGIQLR